MNTKIILSIFAILTLLFLSQSISYGDDISYKAVRYYAHRSDWIQSSHNSTSSTESSTTSEGNITSYIVLDENSAYPAMQSEGGGTSSVEVPYIAPARAKVSFYPLYDKEYFYRVSSSEPIRDFRSYNIKSRIPEPEYYGYKTDDYGLVKKHTQPIRDFRDYWNNDDE